MFTLVLTDFYKSEVNLPSFSLPILIFLVTLTLGQFSPSQNILLTLILPNFHQVKPNSSYPQPCFKLAYLPPYPPLPTLT